MALIVAEGFDDVSNNTAVNSHLGKVYSYSGATISVFQNGGGVWGGRYGHGYAKGLTNTNSDVKWSLPSGYGTMFFACALRRSTTFTSVTPRIQFNRNGTNHIEICFGGTDGSDLVVRKNGTQIGSSIASYFTANVYKWLSIKLVIDSVNGLVEIRDYQGSTIFSFTGDTYNTAAGAAAVNEVLLPTGGSSINNARIDDVFIMDTTGTSWNGHLTEMSIKPLYANADGDLTTGWTASGAASLWDCVDEAFFDGDTTYAYATNPGQRLSVHLQDPAGTENVRAVIVNSAVRRDDAGSWSWKNFLRIGSTNYDDSPAATSAGDSYVHRSSIWYTNPSNGANWTPGDLTNIQAGIVN